MSRELFFLIGALCGIGLTGYVAVILHLRKVAEITREFTAQRETIRRHAFARGYEERAMLAVKGGRP